LLPKYFTVPNDIVGVGAAALAVISFLFFGNRKAQLNKTVQKNSIIKVNRPTFLACFAFTL